MQNLQAKELSTCGHAPRTTIEIYPRRKRKGKTNLQKQLENVLTVDVITLMQIRNFAKQARQYLIAYHAIDSGQVKTIHSQSDRHGPVAVEKLIGKFRTHGCAMDFDFKFVIRIDDND